MFTRGKSAGKLRTNRHKESKGRLTDGRSTHFIVGYAPFDFSSETTMKFRGDEKSDLEIPAAGMYLAQMGHPAPYLIPGDEMGGATPYLINAPGYHMEEPGTLHDAPGLSHGTPDTLFDVHASRTKKYKCRTGTWSLIIV